MIVPPTGKALGHGVWDQNEMEFDTHLCSSVVSKRASSTICDWLRWLLGARQLCSKLLTCRSLGREMARRLMKFSTG